MKTHETIEKCIKLLNSIPKQEEVSNLEWKNRFRDLVELIESFHTDAKEIYDNYSEERLTVNSIEAEGALRAYTILINYIKEYFNFTD